MKKGFSLVELSVVLIIIGILIAATVATSSKLIGNSKLRKVMQEVESMKSGINTFYASFDAYPGDFSKPAIFLMVLQMETAIILWNIIQRILRLVTFSKCRSNRWILHW